MIQFASSHFLLLVVPLLSLIALARAVELTFELPDNAKECFYEEIEAGTEFTVEFQVFCLLSFVF